jgi:hypothetical protein
MEVDPGPIAMSVMSTLFEVSWVEHLLQGPEEVPALGYTNTDAQHIVITTDLGHDRLREVFLHESLHAIKDATGLSRDILGDAESEEAFCKRLAPVLLQWLRDNGAAVAWMRQR